MPKTRAEERQENGSLPVTPHHGAATQGLRLYKHHHALDCGHICRTPETDCASNCMIDSMPEHVKISIPFACKQCLSIQRANARIEKGFARESAPGSKDFFLNRSIADLEDRTRCSGSSGPQHLIRTSGRSAALRQPQKPEKKPARSAETGDTQPITRPGVCKRSMRSNALGTNMIVSFRPKEPPATETPQLLSDPTVPAPAIAKMSPVMLRDVEKLARPRTATAGKAAVRQSGRILKVYGETSVINSLAASFDSL